jgi:hypothetical protein
MLQILKPQFKQAVMPDAYIGAEQPLDLSGYVEPFSRQVELEPLINIVQQGIAKFSAESSWQSGSDSWLSPRVHAALRLSRREAGDRRIWHYLAIGPLRDYVLWRWNRGDEPSGKLPLRFFGATREHAIARLWWGAELTRDGSSYERTRQFFGNTDVPNSWLNLRALRHRPAALATVRFIYEHQVGGVPVGDRHRDLVKGFNAALTTTVLDAVAPNPAADPAATTEWLGEQPDETLFVDTEPTGPNELPVPANAVDSVLTLLTRIAERTNFKPRVR